MEDCTENTARESKWTTARKVWIQKKRGKIMGRERENNGQALP